MPRKLVVAGIVILGVGLALLGYLDPVIRILFFGPVGLGGGAAASFSRSGTFTAGSFTGTFPGRGTAAGGTTLVSLVTIIVFVVMIVGLLLTIAGSFAMGGAMPKGAAPSPAAKSAPGTPGRDEAAGK